MAETETQQSVVDLQRWTCFWINKSGQLKIASLLRFLDEYDAFCGLEILLSYRSKYNNKIA